MTVVEFNDDNMSVKISGHAGYNPGNDIVCAGLSILINTMASIEGIELDTPGIAEVSSSNKEQYDFVKHGIELISFNFPENVKIK